MSSPKNIGGKSTPKIYSLLLDSSESVKVQMKCLSLIETENYCLVSLKIPKKSNLGYNCLSQNRN